MIIINSYKKKYLSAFDLKFKEGSDNEMFYTI